MMGFHGVDDSGIFLIPSAEFHTQLDMGTLHLMIHGLTNVMEQSGTLRDPDIQSKLRRQQS